MSEIISPSEVLPEINWGNPLTDGLTAVVISNGVNTYEIQTGVVTTSTPSMGSIDGFNYWGGEAIFKFSDLGVDPDLNHTVQLIGRFHVDNIGESGNTLRYSTGTATNSADLSVHVDGGYGGLYPYAKSNFNTHFHTEINVPNNKLTSFAVLANQAGAYLSTQMYSNGVLSTRKGTVQSSSNIARTYLGLRSTQLNIAFIFNRYRTLEELDAVADNPYQLFKRVQDVQDEYGLKCVASNGTYVSIADFTLNIGEGIYLECLPTAYSSSSDLRLLGKLGDNYYNLLEINADDIVFHCGNNTTATTNISGRSTLPPLNKPLTVKIFRDATGYDIYINNVLDARKTATENFTINMFGGFEGTTSNVLFDGYLVSLKTINNFWEFNQTFGDIVIDHYNGDVATLVGFPDDSGYVRSYGIGDGLALIDGSYIQGANNTGVANSTDYTVEILEYIPSGVAYRMFELGWGTAKLQVTLRSSNAFSIASQAGSVADSTVITSYLDKETLWRYEFTNIDCKIYGNTVLLATIVLDCTQGAAHSSLNTLLVGTRQDNKGLETDAGRVIKNISVIDNTNSINHYYDFTRILGNSTVVPETINGQDGTMVGFPTNGVFVPEKNKTLVGQQFSKLTDDSVQFTHSPLGTGDFVVEVDFICNESNPNSFVLVSNGGAYGFNIYAQGARYYIFQGDARLDVPWTDAPIGIRHKLTYSKVGTTSKVKLNGTVYATVENATYPPSISTSGNAAICGSVGTGTTYNGDFTVYSASIGGTTLDFSIEAGSTIRDTSGNGNHGTVVGGKLKRVYDYTGYGEIAGYKFIPNNRANVVFSQIPITGVLVLKSRVQVNNNYSYAAFCSFKQATNALVIRSAGWYLRSAGNDALVTFSTPLVAGQFYDVEFRLDHNTNSATMYIDGNSEGGATGYTIDLSSIDCIRFNDRNGSGSGSDDFIYANLSVEDDTGLLLDYDFTTGDQGKIVETIQGKHAIISNDSVVKWQPIVEDVTFTIGTGKDYATTNTWFSANSSDNSKHHTLIMYEMESDTKTYNTTNLQKGYTYQAAAGLEPINNVAQVGFSGTFTSRAGDYATIDYKNIGIGKLTAWGTLCTHMINGCVWDVSTFPDDTDALANSSTVKVRDTYVKCASGTQADGLAGSNGNVSTTLYVNNSIIEGAGRFAVLYGTCVDTVFINNTIDLFNSVNAENCVTTKSSLAGSGNKINAQSDWFTTQGQITAIGQAAIGRGTGWQGSDLVTWAYAQDTIPDENITVSFDDTLINTLLDDMVITNHTTVSFDDAIVTPVIENMNLQRTTALVFDNIVVGSSIDTLTLIRHTTVAYMDSQVSCTLDDMDIVRSTAVEFQDAVVETTIENMVITVHDRLSIPLVFEDALVSSVIEDMVIIRNTSVEFEDLLVGSTIEDMVIVIRVQDTISLEFEDTLVSMTIEDMSITVHDRPSIPLQFEDTLISLVGEDMDLVVTRTLQFEDSVVGLTVGDMVLTGRQTSVEFEDAIVNSIVNDMELTGRQTSLSFDKTIVNSTIEDMAISKRAFLLEFEDTVVNSKIEDMGLQRYTSLVFEDAVINSTIDGMYLVTEKLPVFNNLKLDYNRIDRKLIKGHMPLITLTKQT